MIRSTARLCQRLSLAALCLSICACGGADDSGAGDSAGTAAPPAAAPATSPPPSAAGPSGTSAVAGTIIFDGQTPQLKPVAMDADPECASKHDGPVAAQSLVLGEGQTLGNVFVQVKNPPAGTYPAPTEPVVVDQKGCLYQPRVAGVLVGQALQFRNSDGILHNVHGLPKANREFNLGMPPSLKETDTTFNKPEPLFPVKCDVHPWMRTHVAVMTHPFFAVTGDSGEFAIDGLPAGTWEVEAWHEKLGTVTATVTVADGETGAADFSFAVPTRG